MEDEKQTAVVDAKEIQCSENRILPNGDIFTHIFFLDRDELYDTVKPYTIRYDAQLSIPTDNIRRTQYPLFIKNLRSIDETFNIPDHGFQTLNIDSAMKYEEYENDEIIRTKHVPEILAKVQQALAADDIHALEYVVRRRHPTWPVATGDSYDYEQPASRAHIDFTHDAVVDIVNHLYEDQAERVLTGKWQVINAWHPLSGPTRDWPLAVCDASTVDFENDAVPGDIVQADRVTENLQIHHNQGQKWYYLRDQMPSEMLLFKNADSDSENGATWGESCVANTLMVNADEA